MTNKTVKPTPYKNAYHRFLDDDDTVQPDVKVDTATEEVETGNPPAPDTTDWQKRYSDLRRYSDEQNKLLRNELSDVRRQLGDVTRTQVQLPATEEEIDEWAKSYPEVAKIIQTLAIREARKVEEVALGQVEDLKRQRREAEFEAAQSKLLTYHADAMDLRRDPRFHTWVKEQPALLVKPLYDTETFDARAVARIIDLYKKDVGLDKPRAKKSDDADAAGAVRGARGGEPPTADKKFRFSESQVKKMSNREYEKYSDDIDDAIRDGTFLYDLTRKA